jgi:hypothetical protein
MDFEGSINVETLKVLDELLLKRFGFKLGDKVVLAGALPDLLVGKTNFIKLHEIGDW